MADAREDAVWTNHANKDHTKVEAYTFDGTKLRNKLETLQGVSKVIDLGCGSALWRNLFKGFDYQGVDQNEAMLRVARERFPEDKFVLSNGMALPFVDGSIDLIFTAAVLQHNRHKDKDKVVTEMVRVLRKGGYYFCTETTFVEENFKLVFGEDKQLTDDFTDGYSFTPVGWKNYMQKFGLKQLWFDGPGEYLYIKE